MSAPPRNNPLNSASFQAGDHNLEEYVKTPEFDSQCCDKARERALSSNESSDSYDDSISSTFDSVTSITTAESAPYEVSKDEACHYYDGVSPKGRGPKLIYRTSSDVLEKPSGPEAYWRPMRIIAVPDDHEFAKDDMWNRVRDKVVEFLNQRSIKVSSVDFVRFTWLDKSRDQEIVEEDDNDDKNDDNNNDDDDSAEEEEEIDYDDIPPIKPVEYGIRHFSNPTIWVGVLPNTLTGAVAHESAKDIRAFLDELQVQNIDIAYRESISKFLLGHGPALFPPVEHGDTLKDVIDNVSVPLSLPIAACKTNMQGTLGPYFRVGSKLYAITVRHNVFSLNGDNDEFRHHDSAPKKEVVVMSTAAYTNYLASIQAHICALIHSVEYLERQVNRFRGSVEAGIDVEDSTAKLAAREAELTTMRTNIDKVKEFFVHIKERWSKPKDRVIGFVAWAPPIGVGVAPHCHTRDLCVIELYKDKFKNMVGNILSLGPECTPWHRQLRMLMYDHIDIPPEFNYLADGLLPLRGMLTADQINNPNSLNVQGDHIRRVVKRGLATNTTVGTLTRFMSFVRKYFITGNMESLELPILSHEKETGTFSKEGDSGSLIVSPLGEFVGLLTSGTNEGTDASDITFATHFEWVWELVCEEFPGANLYFDDLQAFFADVA